MLAEIYMCSTECVMLTASTSSAQFYNVSCDPTASRSCPINYYTDESSYHERHGDRRAASTGLYLHRCTRWTSQGYERNTTQREDHRTNILAEVTLSAYADAGHWVILVFFPKAWSFICPTEIRAFNARLEEFLYTRMCAVVFASTDSEQCLKAWNNTSEMEGGLGGVHIPLISDSSHRISKLYNILIEEEGVAQRAAFIIDPKGIVRNVSISDADVGRNVDEIQRLIDALAFKDAFGEGCPSDWKKGDEGLKFADATKIEGPIELKKSWTEWARPRIGRAWSATSQRSLAGAPSNRSSGFYTPAQPSPMVSPTSNGESLLESSMESAMARHTVQEKNMEATAANQFLGVAV